MEKVGEDILEKLQSGQYSLIPTWERYLRLVTLLGVVYLIFYVGAWTKDMEASTENHRSNDDIHRPLKEDQNQFIPRREYEITLKNIENILKKIEKQ